MGAMDGLCLLVTLTIAAHSPDHRRPPSCSTAMDCHLNGQCIAGACKCTLYTQHTADSSTSTQLALNYYIAYLRA